MYLYCWFIVANEINHLLKIGAKLGYYYQIIMIEASVPGKKKLGSAIDKCVQCFLGHCSTVAS